MGDLITMPVHTSGSVDDYFVIEGLVLSTRCADAFKAMDRASKESVALWKLRSPLPVNSESVRQFLNRLAVIGDIDPPLCAMSTYGVDAQGIGFAVFPVLLGHSFAERSPDTVERERLFGAAVHKLEVIHDKGLVCGDLCCSSFWVNRFGDTSFIGVMGAFDAEMISPETVPPLETLHFVAPEQRDGGAMSPATDVFALGVLGYYMLTGEYPWGAQPPVSNEALQAAAVKTPSSFGAHVPGWADEVLGKCLAPDPAHRYANAGVLFKAIAGARQRQLEQQTPVSVKQEAGTAKPAATSTIHAPLRVQPHPEQAKAVEPKPPGRGLPRLSLLLAAVLAVVIIIGLIVTKPAPLPVTDDKMGEELRRHMEAVEDPGMREGISEIANPHADIAAKQKKIEEIANSDDPLSHELLVKIALDAPSLGERELAEKAILSRATRLGLKRSAEQVRQWLRASGRGEHPQGYGAILRSLNTTLPRAVHENMLKEAYPTNPKVVLRLTTALAFDTEKPKEYQPVLAQFLVDQAKDNPRPEDELLPSRSAAALVLASSELSVIFAEEAIQYKNDIPNEDLLWVLRIAAERGDPSVRTLAALAAERSVFSPLRQVYIQLVMKRENLPKEVLPALIRAAAGALRPEDARVLGSWLDLESEKVCFAICADEADREAQLEAFDLLAGKSIAAAPIRALIEWIRREHWSERAQFMQVVGTLGMIDKVSPEQVGRVVDSLSKYLDDPEVLKMLLDLKNPLIVKTLLMKYPSRVGLSTLVELLDFPDREVCMMVIRQLKSWDREVLVIKMALDRWDREKDPDIRKLLEESFWSVKQRAENQQE